MIFYAFFFKTGKSGKAEAFVILEGVGLLDKTIGPPFLYYTPFQFHLSIYKSFVKFFINFREEKEFYLDLFFSH